MAIPAGLLEGIDNLDPLPITAQRLTAAIAEDKASTAEIAKIVEYDEAIASNILRVANSALYGGRFLVESIRDAVVRLGTNTLLNVILQSHFKKLRVNAAMYDLTENDLWLHSAVASLAVTEIIRESSNGQLPRITSIAALVHDIGKLVMVRYLRADVRTLLERCEEKQLTFVEAERDLFGCDHSEVGAAMARKWNFPEAIVEAVQRHHDFPVDHSTPVLDAVILANLIAKTVGVGLGAEGMNFQTDPQAAQRLGIDFDAFCRICARTTTQMTALKQAYGI